LSGGKSLFVALWTLSALTISGFLSIAVGHDRPRPDLRRTLDYIASNVGVGAHFESSGCEIKMADVQSTEGTETISFSLADIDLSKGDVDTPGVAITPRQMVIFIPSTHVIKEDHKAWSFDEVLLNTPNKRLARAFSHGAKLCGAKMGESLPK
jgi:hypothetical protein